MKPNRWFYLALLASLDVGPDLHFIVTNFAAQLAAAENEAGEVACADDPDGYLLVEGSPNTAYAWGNAVMPLPIASARAYVGSPNDPTERRS